MHLKQLQSGWVLAMVVLSPGFSGLADCVGPPALQARIHTNPDAQTYSQLGAWFGQRGEFNCAVEALQAGLRLQPDSTSLNYYLGLSLFSSGHGEEAIRPLERTAELDAKALQPHLILATIFAQTQQRDEAKTQWLAALRIDPASTVALDGLSQMMNASGDYESTIDLLRSAKLNEYLALNLAFAYSRSEKLDRASVTLIGALRAAPSSARLTNALARVYIQQQRTDSANELLKKFLRLHPDDVEGQRMWLSLLVLNGEFSTAQPLAVKLLALDPHNFDVVFVNGILEHQAANYVPARLHLEEAVALNPDASSPHYYLGLTLVGLEDNEGARKQLERAVALDPSNREAHFQLAAVLRTLGEKKLSLEQSSISQQLFESKAQLALAKPKAEEAERKLAAGDTHGAVALYREAFETAPKAATIAYRLAIALDRDGDTAAERSTLEQAIGIAPDMASAQNQLGYVISREGDATGAEKHFELAVKAEPDYTQAWVNLAASLAVQSRFPEAQQALAQALRLDPANVQAKRLEKELSAGQSQR